MSVMNGKQNLLVLIDGREISKKRGLGHFCRELLYNINDGVGSARARYMCMVPADTPESLTSQFQNIDFIRLRSIEAILWEQLFLPVMAWRHRVTHLICPYNTFPIFLPSHIRRVIVYHDLIFFHASRVRGGVRLFLGNKYRSMLTRFVKETDIILSVSEYTRKLVRRVLGLQSVVIGNSCRHILHMVANARPPARSGEYFLHIGGDALTKNTELIVTSFLDARKIGGAGFPSLIVLGVSRNFARTLRSALRFGDEIVFKFNISDEEKYCLIKGCIALVFVSTKEGFGLPIIEGHAARRRVITSRRRPMSDIAAGSDLLVSPTNKKELTAAYLELATQQNRNLPVMPNIGVEADQFRIIESLL